MGTKLGSVYFDVKGNKGDLGSEKGLIFTRLIPSPSVHTTGRDPLHPDIYWETDTGPVPPRNLFEDIS
jgi:hypothetical protein